MEVAMSGQDRAGDRVLVSAGPILDHQVIVVIA
jgi:hypothetical protein